jgi:protocatechuate 3,4-dioxygenase beta subunit
MSKLPYRRALLLAAGFAAVTLAGLVLPANALAQRERPPRPTQMSWQARAVPDGEPGEPLVVGGTVYAADGTTPKPGAIVYAYQTDARGLYTPDGRPGVPRLHAFMRTDERGRYEFRTIRPASYPGQTVAAHIHMAVEAEGREYRVEEIHFDGDPLLTPQMRSGLQTQGRFASVCRPEKDAGALRCTRHIRLEP